MTKPIFTDSKELEAALESAVAALEKCDRPNVRRYEYAFLVGHLLGHIHADISLGLTRRIDAVVERNMPALLRRIQS